MQNIIIGIDLGGTKIMTGAISQSGDVLGKPIKTPTNSHEQSSVIIKTITDSVEKLLKNLKLNINDVLGIGIGTTGPLNINEGIILECPQLPTMHFFPLRKTIERFFSVPVYINNDANCLIYAETIFGNATGKKNVVGFTLGTGIGSAIILDKKILNGATGTAGEVWASPYKSGIIEDYISGDGVAKIYKSISGQNKSSLEVFNLANKGDKDALLTWKEFGEHLAIPIAWSINLIDPDIVVLGGSISSAHKYFMPSMEDKLRKIICPVPSKKTKIVLARLGDYTGFIGAACLVIENK
ncbi:MAG: ROK family protein [Flavobacteriaceae bacterium]|nr:ROK family protein [Flavobacteriaceae bacterium]